jgi:hypothetical protein
MQSMARTATDTIIPNGIHKNEYESGHGVGLTIAHISGKCVHAWKGRMTAEIA